MGGMLQMYSFCSIPLYLMERGYFTIPSPIIANGTGKCNFFLLKSEKNKGYMKIAQNSGKVIDAEGKLLYNELDILEK